MQRTIQKINAFLDKHNVAPLLLRIGLATVFTYAAVSSFLDPRGWVGYLPSVIVESGNAEAILKVFSVYELLLAAWLLSGVYIRYAGLLCALTLSGITVFNFDLFAISFRDIGLAFAALALLFTKE